MKIFGKTEVFYHDYSWFLRSIHQFSYVNHISLPYVVIYGKLFILANYELMKSEKIESEIDFRLVIFLKIFIENSSKSETFWLKVYYRPEFYQEQNFLP